MAKGFFSINGSVKKQETLFGRNVITFLIMVLSINLIFSQQLASTKSKFVGNIISDGNDIRSDFSKYWNQVTAENAGKWGSVEYSQGSYNWTQLDKIYNYAISNGFPYKHHTLVWGSQEPSFMSGLDSATQYSEVVNWIDSVGRKYPLADFCDVVNEPLHAQPSYKNALGGDGETGWDWVIKSFELAKQFLSPNTKLILNEYSVINDGSANAKFLQIINLLKERNLIDGIGVQAHTFEVNGGASVGTLTSNLDNLAATGIPIYISEFDINESDDNTQLTKYQSIFPAIYEHPGVAGITLWGYVQYDIWKADAYLITERKAERPALQWLRTYLASPLRPALISPVDSTLEDTSPLLVWLHSDSALTYNVQLTTSGRWSTILIDTTVADTLLQLDSLSEATKYYWRVSASNEAGTSYFSSVGSFTTGQITGVEKTDKIPTGFTLKQNYPNPFNPTTKIEYSIGESGNVSLKVFNVLGEEVAELVNREQSAGNYEITFNGEGLAGGIYFYRLASGNNVLTKKLVLLK